MKKCHCCGLDIHCNQAHPLCSCATTRYAFRGTHIYKSKSSNFNYCMPSPSLVIGYYFNPDDIRVSFSQDTRRQYIQSSP